MWGLKRWLSEGRESDTLCGLRDGVLPGGVAGHLEQFNLANFRKGETHPTYLVIPLSTWVTKGVLAILVVFTPPWVIQGGTQCLDKYKLFIPQHWGVLKCSGIGQHSTY